jgi:N-acetylglucosamine-6-phosphate deacetylase
MASASPAAFLGLTRQRGTLAPGQAADLVLLDDQLNVQRTWINGVG